MVDTGGGQTESVGIRRGSSSTTADEQDREDEAEPLVAYSRVVTMAHPMRGSSADDQRSLEGKGRYYVDWRRKESAGKRALGREPIDVV